MPLVVLDCCQLSLTGQNACYESGVSFYFLRCCALRAFFLLNVRMHCSLHLFATKFISVQVGREIPNYPLTNKPS